MVNATRIDAQLEDWSNKLRRRLALEDSPSNPWWHVQPKRLATPSFRPLGDPSEKEQEFSRLTTITSEAVREEAMYTDTVLQAWSNSH